jgi:hypothetical protein
MIAALFVADGGCYFGVPGVDPWPIGRDARQYAGPWPVVAHPPCQRWGRYWGGAPLTWPRLIKGDDDGCFAFALASVRRWGGVLEHPEASAAWDEFGLVKPPRSGAWVRADWLQGFDGWTCCVEQGAYGHAARKATWLYAHGVDLASLKWGVGEQRLDPRDVEKFGRAKASRIGIMAHLGGGGNAVKREATPEPFRDLLISIAQTVKAPA